MRFLHCQRLAAAEQGVPKAIDFYPTFPVAWLHPLPHDRARSLALLPQFEFRRVSDSLHDELSSAISTLTSVY